jgi:hypothetical protein
MSAMQRRSGGLECVPDVFVITSLDVVIHRDKKLGQGGFGQVYQGEWQGTRVAVKILERNVPPFVSRPCLISVLSSQETSVLDVSEGDQCVEEASTSKYIGILRCLFDC